MSYIFGHSTLVPIKDKETVELIKEKDLPVMLPEVENYKPSDDGKSPLSLVKNCNALLPKS